MLTNVSVGADDKCRHDTHDDVCGSSRLARNNLTGASTIDCVMTVDCTGDIVYIGAMGIEEDAAGGYIHRP